LKYQEALLKERKTKAKVCNGKADTERASGNRTSSSFQKSKADMLEEMQKLNDEMMDVEHGADM
jgi:hypothetical protein